MATYTNELLSGSTDGKMIKVAASSSPGTTIHTAHATAKDQIYLYAVNTSSTAVKLTIEWGGTSSTDDVIEQTIPPESGLILVIPGLKLTNSLLVKAYAASANVILINGEVIRIA